MDVNVNTRGMRTASNWEPYVPSETKPMSAKQTYTQQMLKLKLKSSN